MSERVVRGIEWCKSLYLKGHVSQAHAIMNAAIQSHDKATAEAMQAEWFAFLANV
jgi:hypothetical protein